MKCTVQITLNMPEGELEVKAKRFNSFDVALAYVRGATVTAIEQGATSVTVIVVPARLWRAR